MKKTQETSKKGQVYGVELKDVLNSVLFFFSHGNANVPQTKIFKMLKLTREGKVTAKECLLDHLFFV